MFSHVSLKGVRGPKQLVEFGLLETNIITELDGFFSDAGEHKVYDNFITTLDRQFGARISHEISMRYGELGLEGSRSITVNLYGHAGDAFCAFLAKGVSVTLEGDANDFVGECLSGGKLVVYPSKIANQKTEENLTIGNASLFAATSGECWFRGLAGDQFAIQNSGANVIVEAPGDNGCEYMTGGRVIVLGTIGRNFAAEMTGGIAYVFSQEDNFSRLINSATVDLDGASTEDLIFVKSKIEEFVKLTGSELAQQILTNWQKEHLKIMKVFPRDYKRVLAKQEEERKNQAELDKANLDMILLSVDDSKPRIRTLPINMQIAPTSRRISHDLRPQEIDGIQNAVDLQDIEESDEEIEDIDYDLGIRLDAEIHSDAEIFSDDKILSDDEIDSEHEEEEFLNEWVRMQLAMDLARRGNQRKKTIFLRKDDRTTCIRCILEAKKFQAEISVENLADQRV